MKVEVSQGWIAVAIAVVVVAGLLVNRELARRHKAEADVAENHRKLTELNDLLDHAHVMLRGLDGTIRLWTSGAEQVYGWKKAEAIGRISHELLRTEFPAPLSEINNELITTGHWDGLLRHHRRDGSVVVKHSQWLLHRNADGGTSVLEINRNVTEQKRAEELARASEVELRRSNEELERFAYVASHDLQEPLRMVASYVQLLAKRYKGKLDSDADEFIGYASDGAVRMQRLIEDLLAFSRIGTRGTAMQKTDTATVLAGALANLKLAIDESGATVSSGNLPTVDGDAGQLGHLFQNLVSNALKFRREEPPLVDIFAEQQDKEWLFRVHDNGIGIEPQYFERIFVIFQRLHGRERYSGNGIGLSIARKIVERHGGRMWVESEPGRGTTFFFTLPVAKEG
jgi:chemotaxis family two-component system sensor kinase Cph1